MADEDHEIHRLLGEIVGNQRSMFKEQQRVNKLLEKHFEDDRRNFEKVNTRIRGVEQKVNYAAGAVAFGITVITIFWQSFLGLFKDGA